MGGTKRKVEKNLGVKRIRKNFEGQKDTRKILKNKKIERIWGAKRKGRQKLGGEVIMIIFFSSKNEVAWHMMMSGDVLLVWCLWHAT